MINNHGTSTTANQRRIMTTPRRMIAVFQRLASLSSADFFESLSSRRLFACCVQATSIGESPRGWPPGVPTTGPFCKLLVDKPLELCRYLDKSFRCRMQLGRFLCCRGHLHRPGLVDRTKIKGCVLLGNS